jgi:hypothetical protein
LTSPGGEFIVKLLTAERQTDQVARSANGGK